MLTFDLKIGFLMKNCICWLLNSLEPQELVHKWLPKKWSNSSVYSMSLFFSFFCFAAISKVATAMYFFFICFVLCPYVSYIFLWSSSMFLWTSYMFLSFPHICPWFSCNSYSVIKQRKSNEMFESKKVPDKMFKKRKYQPLFRVKQKLDMAHQTNQAKHLLMGVH